MDYIRDPSWEFIGTIIGALLVILIYRLQRTRKSLEYEVLSDTPLLTRDEKLEGDLQLLFKGRSVENVDLLLVKIFNSGNVPIISSDYERRISLKVDPPSKILTAEITEKEPASIDAEITFVSNHLEVSPVLLNAKDSITIKALVCDYCDKLQIDARIVGVKEIRQASDKERLYSRGVLFGLLLLLGAAFFLIPSSPRPAFRTKREIIGFTIATIGTIISFGSMLADRKNRAMYFNSIKRLFR